MTKFVFHTCKSLIHGAGSIRQAADYLLEQNVTRVLIVTDPGIIRLNLIAPLLESLKTADITYSVFNDVQADPNESIVMSAVMLAKTQSVEAVIGFGGGSSMDVAKLAALLTHSDQSLQQIYGVDNAQGQRLPLIQIPTTAGTGSEVTPIAIVTTINNEKKGVVSPILIADQVLLDPELTLGLPPEITAATGIDAMVHAIEAFTSKLKKNPISDFMAREALRLLAANIRTAVQHGNDVEAREKMLLGSMLAGQAFANAPVAAVHALAYPLGGHFHIPHGLSNSLILPHVMRFNAAVSSSEYAELAPFITPSLAGDNERVITSQLIDSLQALIRDLGLPTRLRDVGIAGDQLQFLAQDAMKQQRLLMNNPREIAFEDALTIYQAAY
ncbi:iron-containing alcohol dehydrogenase [Amphritea sp. HPY]|uniref:iron-containing alcohol dehydrogenase n=1 Tax=Amphritea sp. HPY TaxID=3421652 RepID=UPI003D7DC95D